MYVSFDLLDLLSSAGVLLVGALFGTKPRPVSGRSNRGGDAAEQTRVRTLEAERRETRALVRATQETIERIYDVERVRDIPAIAIEFMVQLFAPQEALVLIRRRPAVTNTDREHQLIVAASTGRTVRQGTVLDIGRGPLSQVAQRGVVQERPPAPETEDEFRGFRPDLAVPMTSKGETMGVLAVSGVSRRPFLAIRLLQLLASAAAQTYRSSSTLFRMRTQADLDSLTGVLNKGALTQLLAEFSREAIHSGRTLSVFIFDVDHFKNYNDTNGHPAGDDCLRLVSRLVAERVRSDDAFGRWGGEEFLLLLPDREPREACLVAEEIRNRIADFRFPHGEKQPLGLLSVSGGVASIPDHAHDGESVVEAADRALYAAKHAGRNRVEVATELEMPRLEVETAPEEPAREDDLTRIDGIGEKFAAGLKREGIVSFRQVAELDWNRMMTLAEALGTNPERIVREQWLAQARELDGSKPVA